MSDQGPTPASASSGVDDDGGRNVEVTISIRTILLVGAAVVFAWALASIGDVLLLIFVAGFGIAVLTPVVDAMERRLPWSRGVCSTVLILGLALVVVAAVLILLQAVINAVGDFSDDLPQLIAEARDSDVGRAIDDGGALETLQSHAGDITSGAAEASGGLADVGLSAFGVVTLVFSVTFLTLFGLVEMPRVRDWVASLLYRDKRERVERVSDRIIQSTSRYMLGNLAISVICATVYGVAAVILDLPYPLALAVIAGFLDLIPNFGSLIAGIIIGIVALSVSTGALIAIVVVMVVYQQIENYILQPTIIGKAAHVSGFTVLASILVFGALFGIVGAIIGVSLAAAIQIVLNELTADRRARIAAADAAEQQQPA